MQGGAVAGRGGRWCSAHLTAHVPASLPPPPLRSCVYDVCALPGDMQLLCQDYEAYAQLCQEEAVALGPWREKTGCGE